MSLYRRFFIAFCGFVVVVLVGTAGLKIIAGEKHSLGDCAYNTFLLVCTVTTPFDKDPEISSSQTFKVFATFLLIGGMGTILYMLTTMMAFVAEGELTNTLRRRRMDNRIKSLRDHIIVCGAGDTGCYIAEELLKIRFPFVIIESSQERIERLKTLGDVLHITGDATEDVVLEKAGIKFAAGIILALPGDKENLFATITARQLNPQIKIVAKGIEPLTDNKLLRAGADKVVSPSAIGGFRMVSEMVRPTVVTFLDKMMRDPQETTRIEEMTIGDGSELANKTLSEARITSRAGVLILAIKPPESKMFVYHPAPETRLAPGTVVVIIGNVESVKKARALGGADQIPTTR